MLRFSLAQPSLMFEVVEVEDPNLAFVSAGDSDVKIKPPHHLRIVSASVVARAGLSLISGVLVRATIGKTRRPRAANLRAASPSGVTTPSPRTLWDRRR